MTFYKNSRKRKLAHKDQSAAKKQKLVTLEVQSESNIVIEAIPHHMNVGDSRGAARTL